jgi:hypothetical protein
MKNTSLSAGSSLKSSTLRPITGVGVAPAASGDDGFGATGRAVGDVGDAAVGRCSRTVGCSGLATIAVSVADEGDDVVVVAVPFAQPASATSRNTTARAAILDRRVTARSSS